ncbi:MAG: hypothetical protein JF614_20990 [Acidobacteria bacterium]|nr:hypothetical protein [Acidobacteriota bacterium]
MRVVFQILQDGVKINAIREDRNPRPVLTQQKRGQFVPQSVPHSLPIRQQAADVPPSARHSS